MPPRPELPLSLFVKLSVFTAALLPWHGACQDLSGPTGNSQAFPLVWLREKKVASTHSTHPRMLKSSAGWKKNGEKSEVDVRESVLNSHYFIQKRCVPSWEMF